MAPFCEEGVGRKLIPLGHGLAIHSLVKSALLDWDRFAVLAFEPLKVVAFVFPLLGFVGEDFNCHDLSP